MDFKSLSGFGWNIKSSFKHNPVPLSDTLQAGACIFPPFQKWQFMTTEDPFIKNHIKVKLNCQKKYDIERSLQVGQISQAQSENEEGMSNSWKYHLHLLPLKACGEILSNSPIYSDMIPLIVRRLSFGSCLRSSSVMVSTSHSSKVNSVVVVGRLWGGLNSCPIDVISGYSLASWP